MTCKQALGVHLPLAVFVHSLQGIKKIRNCPCNFDPACTWGTQPPPPLLLALCSCVSSLSSRTKCLSPSAVQVWGHPRRLVTFNMSRTLLKRRVFAERRLHYLGAVCCISLFPSWLYLPFWGKTVDLSYLEETLQSLTVEAAPLLLGLSGQALELTAGSAMGYFLPDLLFCDLPWVLREMMCCWLHWGWTSEAEKMLDSLGRRSATGKQAASPGSLQPEQAGKAQPQ